MRLGVSLSTSPTVFLELHSHELCKKGELYYLELGHTTCKRVRQYLCPSLILHCVSLFLSHYPSLSLPLSSCSCFVSSSLSHSQAEIQIQIGVIGLANKMYYNTRQREHMTKTFVSSGIFINKMDNCAGSAAHFLHPLPAVSVPDKHEGRGDVKTEKKIPGPQERGRGNCGR